MRTSIVRIHMQSANRSGHCCTDHAGQDGSESYIQCFHGAHLIDLIDLIDLNMFPQRVVMYHG